MRLNRMVNGMASALQTVAQLYFHSKAHLPSVKSRRSNDLTLSDMRALALEPVVGCTRTSVRYLPAITGAEETVVADSANTMSSALEVLGLSLPYSSSTPATYPGALCKPKPELRFT